MSGRRKRLRLPIASVTFPVRICVALSISGVRNAGMSPRRSVFHSLGAAKLSMKWNVVNFLLTGTCLVIVDNLGPLVPLGAGLALSLAAGMLHGNGCRFSSRDTYSSRMASNHCLHRAVKHLLVGLWATAQVGCHKLRSYCFLSFVAVPCQHYELLCSVLHLQRPPRQIAVLLSSAVIHSLAAVVTPMDPPHSVPQHKSAPYLGDPCISRCQDMACTPFCSHQTSY